MNRRDYTPLGLTQSLCPECLELLPTKIIERRGRIYFRKRCREHGPREDFVCSDASWWDRLHYSGPGKIPPVFGVEPSRGCPYDCGLCTEHEQHTCIGLVELTDSCNLTCPMCYAGSAPGRAHRSMDDCVRAIDRLVEVEGRPEVLQLSGGEPTVHPEFSQILAAAVERPIDVIMINTNGLRLAADERLLDEIASYGPRVEVYLQFDGFDDDLHIALRGQPLLAEKMAAIGHLCDRGIRTTLVTTLQPGVNENQIGPLLDFALARPAIGGISFQPATYVGRTVTPEQLEHRITFPDVLQAIEQQTAGRFRPQDFMPLPCAHPNSHTIGYIYRSAMGAVPLLRLMDVDEHLDLLAGGITFDRTSSRELIETYLGRVSGCGGDCACGPSGDQLISLDTPTETPSLDASQQQIGQEFFSRVLQEDLGSEDVLRITITSFMDAYNFDVRQLMQSCVHFVLPSGHVIPFDAYNVLYRDGHVPLPSLDRSPDLVELATA